MSIKSSSGSLVARHPIAWDGLTLTKEEETLVLVGRKLFFLQPTWSWRWEFTDECSSLPQRNNIYRGRNSRTRHNCCIYIHQQAVHLLNRWRSLAPRNSQAKHRHNTISKIPGWQRQQQQKDKTYADLQHATQNYPDLTLCSVPSRAQVKSTALHLHKQSIRSTLLSVTATIYFWNTCRNATLHKIPHA